MRPRLTLMWCCRGMAKDKILISDDFIDWRFHPGATELPYAYSGAILRGEVQKRLRGG